MEDELVLEGTVEDVIFHNDDNGYAVSILNPMTETK